MGFFLLMLISYVCAEYIVEYNEQVSYGCTWPSSHVTVSRWKVFQSGNDATEFANSGIDFVSMYTAKKLQLSQHKVGKTTNNVRVWAEKTVKDFKLRIK
jgi:hypothetical protein